MINVIPKGEKLNITAIAKSSGVFYVGAGWDVPEGGAADLDLVALALVGGKLTKQTDLVYFSNQTGAAGIVLSDDNTTGEGDGDDESIVIDTNALAADVDGIILGLVCYSSNLDFSTAKNPHFRICDGGDEASEEIANISAGDGVAGDTVLIAAKLTKTPEGGWEVENDGQYKAGGNGTASVEAFAAAYQ